MKLKRSGAAVSLVAASALLLSACGSDDNSAETGNVGAEDTSNVDCGGVDALKASGSSAQANAMVRFVNAFEQACEGQTLNYTSNGSGAGVSEFIGGQTDIGGSDSPLSEAKDEYARAAERCEGADAWNLPAVFGPLAITYNVQGVDELALDGPTAANTGTATALPFRLRHWIAPSCSNCSSPCRNCLNLPVSLLCRYEKLSGVKRGIS